MTKLKKCDGTRNCNDGSDEKNCQMSCSGTNEFQCIHKNNTMLPLECISQLKVCNGINDCAEGGDENNCPTECEIDDQFTCSQVSLRSHYISEMASLSSLDSPKHEVSKTLFHANKQYWNHNFARSIKRKLAFLV